MTAPAETLVPSPAGHSYGRAANEGRPLRVGVVNLMPEVDEYERCLLDPLRVTPAPIDAVWLRIRGRTYSRSDQATVARRYLFFEEALDAGPLDALVVTGAAVDQLPYHEVRFIDELAGIVRQAAAAGASILGLCWGALVVAHLLHGVPKQGFASKLFGVFETESLVRDHVIADGFDDRFWSAHSRFAGFDEAALAAAERAGRLRVLARSREAGSVIVESPDHAIVMHAGHPEYEAARLVDEYRRDVRLGLDSVEPPVNFDVDAPTNVWRCNGRAFFAGWVTSVSRRRREW